MWIEHSGVLVVPIHREGADLLLLSNDCNFVEGKGQSVGEQFCVTIGVGRFRL